jgi:hypothetical protein
LVLLQRKQPLAVYSVQTSQNSQNSVHVMAGLYLNHTILGNGIVVVVFMIITNDFVTLL